jgi:hypothetical protein
VRKAGGFDAAFLAVGAHIGKRAYIPAGDVSAKILDAVVGTCAAWKGREADARPPRRRLWRRQHRDRRRAHGQALGAERPIIVYRRNRDKMPAHDFEVEEAMQEGVMIKWLSTIKQAGESSITSRRWRSTRRLSRSRPANSRTLEADSVVLALGQDVDLGLLNGVPGSSRLTAWSRSTAR